MSVSLNSVLTYSLPENNGDTHLRLIQVCAGSCLNSMVFSFLYVLIGYIFKSISAGLSITIFTVYFLIMAISFTITSGSLTFLLKDKLGFDNKKLLLLIIITIILWALKQIPFVGAIVTLCITSFGMGLFVKNIFDKNKKTEIAEKN